MPIPISQSGKNKHSKICSAEFLPKILHTFGRLTINKIKKISCIILDTPKTAKITSELVEMYNLPIKAIHKKSTYNAK